MRCMQESGCYCYFEAVLDAMRDSKENNTERANACNLNNYRLSAHEQKLILGKVDIYNLYSSEVTGCINSTYRVRSTQMIYVYNLIINILAN